MNEPKTTMARHAHKVVQRRPESARMAHGQGAGENGVRSVRWHCGRVRKNYEAIQRATIEDWGMM